jgi:hypothetical protein
MQQSHKNNNGVTTIPIAIGRAVRSRFPMKNRESSTAIPHANSAEQDN